MMTPDLKKIYVTGVTGFIGSNIALACLKNGYDVVGVCRNSEKTVREELGIKVIKSDLLSENNLKFDKAEAIVHCATANDILSKSAKDGLSLSIAGTGNIIESAIKARIPKIIFFSTAQVYGTELSGHYDETTATDCKTTYGINHLLGEDLCNFYCKTKNLDIAVIRPSNVYGVPQISTVSRGTLVPMCFVNEAIEKKSITIRSSGKQMRNFVSNDEVADITLKILSNFPKGFSIINNGSNWCASILEIANMIAHSYEKNFKKKININVNGDEPNISNIFNYSSKVLKPSLNATECKNKMEKVIDQLINK